MGKEYLCDKCRKNIGFFDRWKISTFYDNFFSKYFLCNDCANKIQSWIVRDEEVKPLGNTLQSKGDS